MQMAEEAAPDLGFFSSVFPLPYRIAFLVVMGELRLRKRVGTEICTHTRRRDMGLGRQFALLLCLPNCRHLSPSRTSVNLQQDIEHLIKYNNRSSNGGRPAYLRVYHLAAAASIPLSVSLFLFWLTTRGNDDSVRAWDILPQSVLILLPLCFILPVRRFSVVGRRRLLTGLMRISVGGIAKAQDGKFGDILLADALTSYAKVLGDVFVVFCMFFTPTKSSTALPDRNCGGAWIVPLILTYPSLIRFRQCLIEYYRVQQQDRSPLDSGSSGWGGQHLANALKYLSAIPVIILSALQRHQVHGHQHTKLRTHRGW